MLNEVEESQQINLLSVTLPLLCIYCASYGHWTKGRQGTGWDTCPGRSRNARAALDTEGTSGLHKGPWLMDFRDGKRKQRKRSPRCSRRATPRYLCSKNAKKNGMGKIPNYWLLESNGWGKNHAHASHKPQAHVHLHLQLQRAVPPAPCPSFPGALQLSGSAAALPIHQAPVLLFCEG